MYKPAFLPQLSTTYGAIDNYCGDLFRDVPNGMGVRVSESCAFLGVFQAGNEVSGGSHHASFPEKMSPELETLVPQRSLYSRRSSNCMARV